MSNQTELAKTIFRTLEIPPDTPFRCKDIEDAWYKLTKDCVPLWDAGTDQMEWFEDWVVLNHLLKGTLEPDWNKERIDNLERAIELIKKAKEGTYEMLYIKLDCIIGSIEEEVKNLKRQNEE